MTTEQILDGLREIATQFTIFRTVPIRIFASVRLANCQRHSIESYKETSISDCYNDFLKMC